jgi:hypothetical protein
MSDFGYGQLSPEDQATDFNVITFICRQLINKISTVMPVQIVSVTNSGGLSPAGTVDVQPLVSLLDGIGNASQHGVVHGIPYFRLQGGTNAVIIDPVVGDIGFVTCADHDISSVKATQGPATPSSRRRFSLSDGIYVGGILNGVPQQYIQFNEAGVTIADSNSNQIVMNSQGITLTALNVIVSCNLQLGGSVEAVGGGTYSGTFKASNFIAGSVGLTDHVHGGVTTGSGSTGPATG